MQSLLERLDLDVDDYKEFTEEDDKILIDKWEKGEDLEKFDDGFDDNFLYDDSEKSQFKTLKETNYILLRTDREERRERLKKIWDECRKKFQKTAPKVKAKPAPKKPAPKREYSEDMYSDDSRSSESGTAYSDYSDYSEDVVKQKPKKKQTTTERAKRVKKPKEDQNESRRVHFTVEEVYNKAKTKGGTWLAKARMSIKNEIEKIEKVISLPDTEEDDKQKLISNLEKFREWNTEISTMIEKRASTGNKDLISENVFKGDLRTRAFVLSYYKYTKKNQ